MVKTCLRGMAPPVYSTADAKPKPHKRGRGPNVSAAAPEASDLTNTDEKDVQTFAAENAAAEPSSTDVMEPSEKETESDSSSSSCEASVETNRDTEVTAESKILEEENDSISTIDLDPPEKNTGSGDSSTSGCEDAAEEAEETRVFVALLTARVLSKCPVVNLWTQESLVAYTQQLVDQTLQGLTLSGAFCPNEKDIKKMCKAVIDALKTKYGNMRKLETAIFSEHPSVDAAIVVCLRAHIKEHSARAAHKKKKSGGWRQHIWPLLHVAGICALWGILFLILA
ncbi:uncharacterized protein [Trachinotus anak]|uniref:uncharacterized protein n=1 Tax=Trachinotus anak TaxID=443729 RepID=UPI0039F1DF66